MHFHIFLFEAVVFLSFVCYIGSMMNVKILKDKEELNTVAPCEIGHLLWGTSSIPRTYFYIGFVPGDGFYVRMVCEERDPRRTFTSPTWTRSIRDSAMEAFLLFPQEGGCPLART